MLNIAAWDIFYATLKKELSQFLHLQSAQQPVVYNLDKPHEFRRGETQEFYDFSNKNRCKLEIRFNKVCQKIMKVKYIEELTFLILCVDISHTIECLYGIFRLYRRSRTDFLILPEIRYSKNRLQANLQD